MALALASAGCGGSAAQEPDPKPANRTLERGATLDSATSTLASNARELSPIPAQEPEVPAATGKDLPKGVEAIGFQDLSLLKADVNGLLEMIFAPEGQAGDTSFEFPDRAQSLDGEQVAIMGYMIPLDWVEGEDRITSFMLVRDFAQCCFGGVPRPDEWIDVTTEKGESVSYYAYRPIRVIGTLHVGLDRPEDSMVASVFQLTLSDVSDLW